MKRQNKRNLSLYICIEISIILIASAIGFAGYLYASEISPKIDTFYVRIAVGIIVGLASFMMLEVTRKSWKR
jgi:preprotein translocase subunit Sec61beta